jgi:hypothetical protein
VNGLAARCFGVPQHDKRRCRFNTCSRFWGLGTSGRIGAGGCGNLSVWEMAAIVGVENVSAFISARVRVDRGT